MTYFSRLTDIVTCNLSSILADAEDPQAALQEIIFEMKEGVAGAERSVNTANMQVSRIEIEIGEQRTNVDAWMKSAQDALANQNEALARQSLERKHEVEDLIAGLEQQLEAAISTRDHLRTMLNALQARMADAIRRGRQADLDAESSTAIMEESEPTALSSDDRQSRIEAELNALRKQMESR